VATVAVAGAVVKVAPEAANAKTFQGFGFFPKPLFSL